MDSRLYETKLGSHKIFKDIKESLREKSDSKLRNLTVLKDDVFYVWNSIENCVFSVNVQHLEEHEENTPYQKLHLLSPPPFPVERMMGSICGSRLCLWGARGVTIVELPSRWGKGGLFDSGNQTVLCKSYCLDERFLYSLGEVRRVHWHPTSFSHLLVLVSDNTIRLYNIGLKAGPKLVKTFTVGRKPVGPLGWTLQEGAGNAAVELAPLPGSDSLLVLTGDGDVLIMHCTLDGNSGLSARVSGPLRMFPPADDNYGAESCSLAALGGGDAPPLLVIATCSGTLYHCLLLPTPTEKENDAGYALYVVEMVELNIVLNPDDILSYSYPVHLYNCTHNTYACVHAGGVHTVTLPILEHLKDYALASEGDTDSILSAICSKASTARHLVCTSESGQPSPPVGFAVTAAPLPTLLVLCDDGVLLSRTLEPYDLEDRLYKEIQLKNPGLNQDDINVILKERQKLSFAAIIQEILAREVSQPLLNLNKDEREPQQSLQLLTQATLKLRGEYIARQQRALDAIARKVLTLTALARQQDDWAADLQKEIAEVRTQAAELKNKLALANKIQEDMKYRCSAVVRKVRAATHTTAAERELLAELEKYRASGEQLAEKIQLVKEHAHYKSAELKKWQEEYKKKDAALGKSHSDTISSILQQQTNQISSLIEETKLLKDQLSIV